MGCGISKFDEEEKSLSCELIIPLRQNNVHPIDQNVDSPANFRGHKIFAWPARVDNNGGVVKEPTPAKEMKMRLLEKEVEKEPKKEGNLHKEEVEEDRSQIDEKEKLLYVDREDRLIGPGSPSFREYCIDWDSASASGDSNNNGIGDGVKREKKSSSMEGSSSPDDDKGSRTQFAKIERKGRGFRSTVLAKGRSTYNPTSSTDVQSPKTG